MTKKILWTLLIGTLLTMIVTIGGFLYGMHYYSRNLPDFRHLEGYKPAVATRLHAGDGRLLAEYAREKRLFVPIAAMPKKVIQAFLSAEDKQFYQHGGVNFRSIIRAAITNMRNYGTGKRLIGASTITQQIAKNFLLSNVVSYKRKIQEAILAWRIERVLSKERILELYLNEIYLGIGSYGVAAAALNYFNKSLDELNIEELAFLAALPKGPENYHPKRRKEAATARRNWVLGRMYEDGYITAQELNQARAKPITMYKRDKTEIVVADYFAEEVRRELAEKYGADTLYDGGLSVRTTLDPRLQAIAHKALQNGLMRYDKRHGWRGPLDNFKNAENWRVRLNNIKLPNGLGDNWYAAVVLKAGSKQIEVGFSNGARGKIPFAEMSWARKWVKNQRVGPALTRASQALKIGDVVLVEPVAKTKKGKAYPQGTYKLQQIPNVQGGIVAMDPHTGRVLAMDGGWSFEQSVFNRATQAQRQPGSSFKPFVYLAALENGYTPSTLVLDAPFVLDMGPNQPPWIPENYTRKYYGPVPMRFGIEKSINLMTIRLAQAVGINTIAKFAKDFNIMENMPPYLPVSLGAGETTLYQMTSAYAMLVNGGRRVTPTMIDRIQDRNGKTIYLHDQRACRGCRVVSWSGQSAPKLDDIREQVVDPQSAYQIVSMMEGVVQRGTGVSIRSLNRPLAGKTGTTNDNFDAWFMGFSPDLVAGIFVGFDQPRTLGRKETGSKAAAPIFKEFMGEALKDTPAVPFRIPSGMRLVRVNRQTGQLAMAGDENTILESFKPGTEPEPGYYPQMVQGYNQVATGNFQPGVSGYGPESDYNSYGTGGYGTGAVPNYGIPNGLGYGGAVPNYGAVPGQQPYTGQAYNGAIPNYQAPAPTYAQPNQVPSYRTPPNNISGLWATPNGIGRPAAPAVPAAPTTPPPGLAYPPAPGQQPFVGSGTGGMY